MSWFERVHSIEYLPGERSLHDLSVDPDFVRYLKRGHYLYAGIGNGSTSDILFENNPHIIGVDSNGAKLDEARKLKQIYPTLDLVVGNPNKLPFADASFDGAIECGQLGQFQGDDARPKRRELISETVRTLRTGAPFYVTEFFRPPLRAPDPNSPLHEFTRDELINDLSKGGLVEFNIRTAGENHGQIAVWGRKK